MLVHIEYDITNGFDWSVEHKQNHIYMITSTAIWTPDLCVNNTSLLLFLMVYKIEFRIKFRWRRNDTPFKYEETILPFYRSYYRKIFTYVAKETIR